MLFSFQICAVSTDALKYGVHKWRIEIIKCDIYRQEIGVVERIEHLNDSELEFSEDGIGAMCEFGARSVYGKELLSDKHYYASYNDNGYVRCKKDIELMLAWCAGDIIEVVINLKRASIQYFLNGIKVRKTISLQKGKAYHPIISFCGNCKYETILNSQTL